MGKLFLDGLNQEFDLRRQLIFSKTEWLSLDDIISSVIEEETRLAQPNEHVQEKSDARAALSIQARRAPKTFAKIGKSNLFSTIAKGLDTQRIHVLSCMVIQLGGKKESLRQGEVKELIKDRRISLHPRGSHR